MLRVLDNPTLDTPLAAVMLSPMFWFTPEELMQIRMLAKKSKLFHAVQIAIGVAEESASEKLGSVLVEKCRHLYDTVQKLRQDSGMMTLESLIRRIYDTTDFLSVMQKTGNESGQICVCCCNTPSSMRRTPTHFTAAFPASCGILTGCWKITMTFSSRPFPLVRKTLWR